MKKRHYDELIENIVELESAFREDGTIKDNIKPAKLIWRDNCGGHIP